MTTYHIERDELKLKLSSTDSAALLFIYVRVFYIFIARLSLPIEQQFSRPKFERSIKILQLLA